MLQIYQRLFQPSQRRAAQHDAIYNSQYYQDLEFSSTWSSDVIAQSLHEDLNVRSVVDVGCGTGALLEAFQKLKVEVFGLEYSAAGLEACAEKGIAAERFDIRCGTLPKTLRHLDLLVSFEVAEHLPARYADTYVKVLTQGPSLVVMSAATPGQGGTDHVNEQLHEYWIKRMQQRGFRLRDDLTQRWRSQWQETTALWYHQNVMLFQRL